METLEKKLTKEIKELEIMQGQRTNIARNWNTDRQIGFIAGLTYAIKVTLYPEKYE